MPGFVQRGLKPVLRNQRRKRAADSHRTDRPPGGFAGWACLSAPVLQQRAQPQPAGVMAVADWWTSTLMEG
ncbi:MAG: hypothetical protein ACOCXY_03040, partial [Planctomycetota bacterium]